MRVGPHNWTLASSLGLLLMHLTLGPLSAAQARVYSVVNSQSTFTISVGKAGLLSALGHEHTIVVKAFGGRVSVPAGGVQQASLELEIDASSLTVADRGINDKERAEIQRAMETSVLEVSRFPKISFHSASITNAKPAGGSQSLIVNGDLTLHGVTKRVAVPVAVTVTPEQLRATGEVTIKQTDFGIKPYSAGGGTVKVKDAVKLSFAITAKA